MPTRDSDTLLHAIRVRTPRLELRLASRDELLTLAEVARAGIHPAERMPFYRPWTDNAQEPRFTEEFAAHHEQRLAEWRPDDWALLLVAFREGRPIGSQGLRAEHFAERRSIETGSWLGADWQNAGLGTEMRAGALELAFAGLDAKLATSGAFVDNPQSARVSEKLGYLPDGVRVAAPRGVAVRERRYRLERASWRSPVPVTLTGVEPARGLFGL